VTHWYEVLFYITGGRSPSGRYLVPAPDWHWDYEREFSPTQALQETRRPLTVFRKLVECVCEYISARKPPYLVINNLENSKRGHVYQKLANRFSEIFISYEVSWSDEGYILICKLNAAIAA